MNSTLGTQGINMDNFEKFKVLCLENGYLNPRQLKDGRFACVLPLLFTGAIIVMNPATFTQGYDDRWCYHDKTKAAEALNKWNDGVEPVGWHRHPLTGRRRDDGDPLKEYINP